MSEQISFASVPHVIDGDIDEIFLTDVSDGTVHSAFSESEQIDFELDDELPSASEGRVDGNIQQQRPTLVKRRPGRPRRSANKKLAALEALFDEPFMSSKRRRAPSASSSIEKIDTASLSSAANLTIKNPAIAEFHRACQYGQVNLMESLLRKGTAKVDCCDSLGNTGLHVAAIHGQIEAIKLLLKMGADVRAENILKEHPVDLCRDLEGASILHDFERMQSDSMILPFLSMCWRARKKGLKAFFQENNVSEILNERDSNENNGLHYAAVWNNEEITGKFLQYGMAVDLVNSKGNTPLHMACRFSSPDVVRLLLEAGSDYRLENMQGNTPIDLSNKLIMRIFRRFAREKGINDPQLFSATVTKRFIEVSEDEGQIKSRNKEIILTKGLSREEKKLRQMMAIFSRSTSNENNVKEVKRKRGRPPRNSYIISDKDDEEKLKLDVASSGEKSDFYSQDDSSISKKFSKTSITNSSSVTGLKFSKNRLIDKTSGRTPLHKASAKGKLERILDLIKEDKTLVNRKDNAGYTALHEAALSGHLDAVKELISAGAKVNTMAANGATPLHDAAINSQIKVVKHLLEKGANASLRNEEGQRPIDLTDDLRIRSLLESSMSMLQRKRQRPNFGLEGKGPNSEEQNLSPRKSQRTRPKSLFRKMVEIESTEPLLQIHCGKTEAQHSGWYFLAPQVNTLFTLTSFKRSHTYIPLSKTRHMADDELDLLLDCAIMNKFPVLKGYCSAGVLLLEKDAVMDEFERLGQSLANVPVMYVDLPRLGRNDSNHNSTTSYDSVNSNANASFNVSGSNEAHVLPPKLKMKFSQRRSIDVTNS